MKKLIIYFQIFFITFFAAYIIPSPQYHEIIMRVRPCITPIEKYRYEICRNIDISVDRRIFIVPKGFETDLLSSPKFMWSLIPPQKSEYMLPAIIHDYFYRSGGVCMTRKYADEILYNSLIAKNVSKSTSKFIYVGVRFFGYKHFKDRYCYINYGD